MILYYIFLFLQAAVLSKLHSLALFIFHDKFYHSIGMQVINNITSLNLFFSFETGVFNLENSDIIRLQCNSA